MVSLCSLVNTRKQIGLRSGREKSAMALLEVDGGVEQGGRVLVGRASKMSGSDE